MISKMKTKERSRIAVITNGSPLFTGDAGSGESDIRKWMIENDYIEAIIALPDQLFYNTGIRTYVWVLTNEKPKDRIGKIQLIDATSKFKKMRKSLGHKRHYLDKEDIKEVIEYYEKYSTSKNVKIFDKKYYADRVDEGNNFDERRTITHARNACFDIAKQIGVTYFIQLDDDYKQFKFRFENKLGYEAVIKNIDKTFDSFLNFYKNTNIKH